MKRLAVLIPVSDASPTRSPEQLPFGRAALRAAQQGVDVVFGETGNEPGSLAGLRAVPGGWVQTTIQPDAVFDRFRSQLHPERYARAHARLGHLPWGNAPSLVALCRDKWASQQVLEAAGVPMPALVRTDFEATLRDWGSAFLKPRYGSFGRNVRRVVPGAEVPAWGKGMGQEPHPNLLQRAIAPPENWAGVSVRALAQRVRGEWISRTPVARRSRDEAVVNVARGAEVGTAQELFGPSIAQRLMQAAVQTAQALDSITEGTALEVGVDLVVDPAGHIWVIEVNGRPRGRLGAVAPTSAALEQEHEDACLAPLLELVWPTQ